MQLECTPLDHSGTVVKPLLEQGKSAFVKTIMRREGSTPAEFQLPCQNITHEARLWTLRLGLMCSYLLQVLHLCSSVSARTCAWNTHVKDGCHGVGRWHGEEQPTTARSQRNRGELFH